ncbi:MAG: helix-turn-helix domain containing protein [Kineosporiaceae bacterium]
MEPWSRYSNTSLTVEAPVLMLCVADDGRSGVSRQRQVRLSPGVETRVVEDYRGGAGVVDLARRYGVHRTTIAAVRGRHGVPRRRRGMDSAQVDSAVRLYTDGWSLARIGDRFGVDGQTVRTALRARQVRMRDRHGRDQ